MLKVLTFGTFDNLHEGHKNFFNQARSLGDELFVVVALDDTVEQVKGRRPVEDQNLRLQAVSERPEVTKAMFGYPDDKYRIIKEIEPDIIALGYDQRSYTEGLESELKKRRIGCEVVRLKAYFPEKYKSSKLR